MSGVLIIGENEKRNIKAAIEHARANTIPWDILKRAITDDTFRPKPTLMLHERKPGLERPESQHVYLGTYRASISFEQQPAGIMRHLSISSRTKGKIPGPQVMEMVCEEFGFSKTLCLTLGGEKGLTLERPFRTWLEEFDPGHMAINVLEIDS